MPASSTPGTPGTQDVNVASPAPVTGLPSGFTQQVFGSQVAPAGGAAVATLAAPGVGNYDITVTAYVGAGAVAAEANNMQLRVGATVIATLPIPPVANGAPVVVRFPRVAVPAGAALTVNAVGAGTATVPYNALIVTTPVN